ncbi:SprT-like domain-containing protein [Halpernia frigidisoli]|uniref:SprT-like family protein n=1 Tax=Halpernia frigidisoli TaxID=1125876 RepID=A0A1I3HI95_9FLAO|nr:SprT-like domain-containing protein [Halpernia frigidisoli]SFI35287.1 SprT-like family protein [Halpernia frigidisoli]
MSTEILQKYLPETAFGYLKIWFSSHQIHLHISRARNSKLGDYQRLRDGSHKITINHNLQPELFFFVLTHELAHLIAFHNFKNKRISPHGLEWKQTFREMLHESLAVYSEELKPEIFRFSRNPKANFMASGPIVKFFYKDDLSDNEVFIEYLSKEEIFLYKKQNYKILEKLKKNYLCENLQNGKKYIFKPLAKVEQLKN